MYRGIDEVYCIENRWSMFSVARNCSSRMYRLMRPIIFLEQKCLVLYHWKFVPVTHDRNRKYVKENVREREFQESHENFYATFKRKVVRIESLEDLLIKIFREFEVAKISLNNALNWTKTLRFLNTNPKNIQAVNKVESGKYKKGP